MVHVVIAARLVADGSNAKRHVETEQRFFGRFLCRRTAVERWSVCLLLAGRRTTVGCAPDDESAHSRQVPQDLLQLLLWRSDQLRRRTRQWWCSTCRFIMEVFLRCFFLVYCICIFSYPEDLHEPGISFTWTRQQLQRRLKRWCTTFDTNYIIWPTFRRSIGSMRISNSLDFWTTSLSTTKNEYISPPPQSLSISINRSEWSSVDCFALSWCCHPLRRRRDLGSSRQTPWRSTRATQRRRRAPSVCLAATSATARPTTRLARKERWLQPRSIFSSIAIERTTNSKSDLKMSWKRWILFKLTPLKPDEVVCETNALRKKPVMQSANQTNAVMNCKMAPITATLLVIKLRKTTFFFAWNGIAFGNMSQKNTIVYTYIICLPQKR